jgi:hypothetical protein
MRWSRPSPAGRRVALERKWRCNVDHYGGAVKLVTLTPPGTDLLAWGDETRVIGGERVRMVAWEDRVVWNFTAQARASRLMEAAQRAADRWLRKGLSYGGPLPRQIGNVKAEQKRGAWHFHYLLPFETKLEKEWSRVVHRYLDRAWRRDLERWPDESVRRELLWREYCGEVTRGFYGFGFVNGGNPSGRSRKQSASYMARNAAGYMTENAAGVGRHYVNARLVRETGVSMRALRACNWLWVRQRMIERGELVGDAWVPGHWDADWREEVLRVYALVAAPSAP